MNPRQRRGALVILLAVIGAIGVLISIFSYVGQVQAQVGPLVQVLAVREDVPAYTQLTEDAFQQVQIPDRWSPPGALRDPSEAVGLASGTALPSGTLLQSGMLIQLPQIVPGQREVAIMVNSETGVAGKIGPGMLVDIYATYPGTDTDPPYTSMAIVAARIIDVGVPVAGEETNPDGSFVEGEFVPVTFALSISDSMRVAHIESFADNVRLGLRAPTDQDPVPDEQRLYQPYPPEPGEAS